MASLVRCHLMVKLVNRTYEHFSIESRQWPGLNLTRFQSLWMEQLKFKALFMLRGIYLKDFFYFYFGMQLGIDLCESINVHRQPGPWCEKLTWKISHKLVMFRKTFSTVSASFVPSRVRVHSDLPCSFSIASTWNSMALRIQERKTSMDRTKTRRTGKIFQLGNPVHVNRRFPDTFL